MTSAARGWSDQKAVGLGVPWAVRHGILWSAAFEAPAAAVSRVAPRVPVTLRRIARDDLPHLLVAAGQIDPIPPEALLRRFELGRECYAAWIGDSIVAYGWLTRGREWAGEFERELKIPDGDAYIWDCATLPAHRRQRLFSALIGHIAEQLAREGVRRLWIISMITIHSMNQDVLTAGFEPVVRLIYLHFHNKRALLITPLPGISPPMLSEARGLLSGQGERILGPLIVGNSARPRPPETHLDVYS